ncbi:glycosyltransferase family 2 protein [Limibaculum sp. M0105]|uniref:Glycosyltransferase family 2 protein n=1 Tax=Thermohalobaculum xanthum TaxID=2753746 RepID=A0A8J7SFU7_9RHOB|nr:glycosyltransferase family A protein [Thermohalobaculum xanthum]MBK0399762.1 glycosyltransferase family 2 protein [Thermohalobaculum xanthum]
MTATVVIVSKNRCNDLRKAIASCLSQTAKPQIIVVDDASTDQTASMVLREFPEVGFIRHEESRGCVLRRNEAAALASFDVIFSIDDDAEFSTPHVVEQALADFSESRIGALSIPLIEPRKGGEVQNRPPDDRDIWVSDTFIGTAYAVRRQCFLKVGGFRGDLIHQGEETDFCIRLLDSGFVVRLSNADPIIHHESPFRDLDRMHYFGRRNDLLFAANNVPAELAVLHMLATTVNGLRAAMSATERGAMLRGIGDGWWHALRALGGRCPVRRETYQLFRQLRTSGALTFSEVAPRLADSMPRGRAPDRQDR